MTKIIIIFFLVFATGAKSSSAYRRVETTYHNKDFLIMEMKNLCKNAENSDYEIIGKSYLGKNIYLFKIGNPKGGRVLMDGSMHGWEDSGTEIMYHFTRWLLNSSDERAKMIMEKNYILLMPIVNIDSTNRQTMRRINPDGKSICCGVDINRNFCAGFGQSGSSNTTKRWPIKYRGLYCASESETQAVIKAMKDYKPAVYVNWHMGDSKLWKGYGELPPKNWTGGKGALRPTFFPKEVWYNARHETTA